MDREIESLAYMASEVGDLKVWLCAEVALGHVPTATPAQIASAIQCCLQILEFLRTHREGLN